MATLDVEALLDATAKSAEESKARLSAEDTSRNERSDHKDSDRDRDRDRDHDRRRKDRRDASPLSKSRRETPDADTPRSDTGSRRRSRSRDDDRRSRRNRDGDFYRSGRNRSRSRSPRRHHRRDDRDRDRRDRQFRNRDDGPRDKQDATPVLNEDERDRRTVFVQQLAARLRSRELKAFFEKVGPVTEAQIVKDRISGRSKGVGYVEFKNEDSVAPALQLTGQKLLGIPVIVQVTEAEKNRQARTTEPGGSHPNHVPFHRLYVGNIHFNVTEQDLQAVFDPFGELEFVQLQKDETNRSRGYGFVQFRDAGQAREALEKMNGFDLAGRPIRVGLGNDKFTPESTANMLQRFSGQNASNQQGSSFSGSGGRGGQNSNFDRAGARDSEKTGGASALDDTDVGGVNFNNYSRDALMRKLARTDESNKGSDERPVLKPRTETKPLPMNVNTASRCVVLHNMFEPDEYVVSPLSRLDDADRRYREEGDDWVKELEDDVRQEAEEKYGHVVHISVDPNSKGDIYLKFDKVQGGENAIRGLNGRYFGGRMIDASPVVDAVYSSLFSRTRAF
ncbi:Splicing CC1 [Cordyceps militaris]|uniref:Splicing CC1 n=1 Tax=Cordyceps militaris TaxID=73501 RepID=A0A2H4SLD9_CORMI|nr:Splicing CC1 [Cordyceps militaris]